VGLQVHLMSEAADNDPLITRLILQGYSREDILSRGSLINSEIEVELNLSHF
jgi:hypothetical protein